MGKKQFCFFQTAETGNRAPDSGVKGSGANHYPRAPALPTSSATLIDNFLVRNSEKLTRASSGILLYTFSDHQPYFISIEDIIG